MDVSEIHGQPCGLFLLLCDVLRKCIMSCWSRYLVVDVSDIDSCCSVVIMKSVDCFFVLQG